MRIDQICAYFQAVRQIGARAIVRCRDVKITFSGSLTLQSSIKQYRKHYITFFGHYITHRAIPEYQCCFVRSRDVATINCALPRATRDTLSGSTVVIRRRYRIYQQYKKISMNLRPLNPPEPLTTDNCFRNKIPTNTDIKQ